MASFPSVSEHVVAAVIDSLAGLERIEPEWCELWQADPVATPFQSPQWLIPWTRHLWGGGKLRVLALRRQGRLIKVAPFFLWGFGQRSEITLSFLGSGISDYLGVTGEAPDTVLDWLGDSASEWDRCDLQELRPDSPLLAAARRHGVRAETQSICPVLPLDASFDNQLLRADAKFRRDLRNGEKRLRAAGQLDFARAGDRDVDATIDRLFELHSGRWECRGGAGMFSTPQLRAFHRDAARRFCRAGMLRLYSLVLNGETIAVQYNFAAKRRVYAYLSGFDPAWSRYSPGSVLLAHSIEHAISEGMQEFDFLRHPADFKYAWGSVDSQNRRIEWNRPS